MIETAIVILNYNGSHYLQQFLPSVIQCSPGASIVVADNGSTDQSLTILKSFPEVQVIEIGQNLGFCGGYNFALRQIKAHYYVLLNSDIEVTPHWIEPVINLMKEDPTIAAAQPKIRSYHQKKYFEYAGASGGFIDWLGYPFCRGRIFDHLEEDQGQYDDPVPVFWATGACLFIKSEVYHSAGGLDDHFFAHMEEIDLCWRLHRMGYKVYCQPQSVIYHVGGGTLSKTNPRKTYLNFRNGLSLLLKNMGRAELTFKLPLRIMLDWVAALKFCSQGNFRDSWMVVVAHKDFFKSLRRNFLSRNRLRSKSFNKGGIVLSKMLVVEYYLKGRKTFDRLRF